MTDKRQISIDLNDLTPELLALCKPHVGCCLYADPCVIGTLMTEDDRKFLDSIEDTNIDDTVSGLVSGGYLNLPEEQKIDASALQKAFDNSNWGLVLEISKKYMN